MKTFWVGLVVLFVGTAPGFAAVPTVIVSDALAYEPEPGEIGGASFTVTLAGAITADFKVNYVTADRTATHPGDYTETTGQLVFRPDGDPVQTITVPVHNDGVPEPDETFEVHLVAPRTLGAPLAVGVGRIRPVAKGDISGDGRSELLILAGHLHDCDPDGVPRGPDPPLTHLNREPTFTIAPPADGEPTFRGAAYGDEIESGDWFVTATGDFNGDGIPDLFWEIWEHTPGTSPLRSERQAAVSLTPPSRTWQVPSSPGVSSPPGAGWDLVGSGDFLGLDGTAGPGNPAVVTPRDGRSDLLWHETATGALSVWASDGAGFPVEQRHDVPAPLSPDWLPLAVADLDGDGGPEIAWRQDAEIGILAYSKLNGLAHDEYPLDPNQTFDQNWRIAGAGDFDADGFDDLVWRNEDSYRLVVWLMQGATRKLGGMVELPPLFPAGATCAVVDVSGPR